MSSIKEEIAADLVWRYVEHVRRETAEGRHVALSAEELDELLEALSTASLVGEAVEAPASEESQAVVRGRLQGVLAAAPEPPPSTAAPAPSARRRAPGFFLGSIPAWAFGLAVSAVLALSLALGTVDRWHRIEVVRRVPVPRDLENVQPITERQAEAMIPRLVHQELDRQEERNLMWHMLVCPGCFDEYVQERNEHRPQAGAGYGVKLASY
jgi:hypothetical protein